MPNPALGVMAATSIGSAAIGSSSASKAAKAQTAAADVGVAETRAAREEMRLLLEPYVAAGGPALEQMMAALGLSGDAAQADYVADQARSPVFQGLVAQGENAILQNASATGGLRGGNTQGALAEFRPAMLNQFLEQQYAKLGGMAQLGQNSAAGVGNAGLGAAGNIAALLQQRGAAQAGGSLAQGNAWGGLLGNIGAIVGMSAGGAFGRTPGFGGGF